MNPSPQGTPGWRAARVGKLTASRIGDALARTRAGWSTSRTSYMGQLLGERLTGAAVETHVTPAMRWGSACEDHARAAYTFYTDREVEPAGFFDHPHIGSSGASPDGLVGADGLLEVKCPTTSTHLDTLMGGEVPTKYLAQIGWQLACTGRNWCDFVSFDPRLPESLCFFACRVWRDENEIVGLEREVRTFLAELDEQVHAVLAHRINLAEAA